MPGLDILETKKHVVRTQINIFDDTQADDYGEQFIGFDFISYISKPEAFIEIGMIQS
jgi:hypothetical protein